VVIPSCGQGSKARYLGEYAKAKGSGLSDGDGGSGDLVYISAVETSHDLYNLVTWYKTQCVTQPKIYFAK
jgi:hypothetical protein